MHNEHGRVAQAHKIEMTPLFYELNRDVFFKYL